jgi:hypothetical protein
MQRLLTLILFVELLKPFNILPSFLPLLLHHYDLIHHFFLLFSSQLLFENLLVGELLLDFLAFGLEDVLFLFVYLLFELELFTAEVFEVLLCLMGFGGVWREVLVVGERQSTEISCQRQRHLR